jgi:hypothetical protein
MNQQRKQSANNNPAYSTQLLKAIRKFLPQRGLPLIKCDRRVRWTDRMLVITAILMAWTDSTMLKDAFVSARDFVIRMYPTRRRPGQQFRGFLAALDKNHKRLLNCIRPSLQSVICKKWMLRSQHRGWAIMGVDGTRISVPRTVANEEGFGVFGKDKSLPQQQLTTVFHAETQLPWTWRHSRGDVSERTHFNEMISELPPKTLLLADAGFTGYAMMRKLQKSGHDFIIRVGSNVRLLCKLGFVIREYDGIVYLWPQRHRKSEPLVLRLVTIIDGSKRVYLLTSVLDDNLLSDAEIAKLYRRRWGIETMYRSLKQTMEKDKLRSRVPSHAQMELDWLMIGFWLLGLMTLDAAGTSQTICRGRSWSTARALRVVRQCMNISRRKRCKLYKLLAGALQDIYKRSGPKRTRSYAEKKRGKPPGQPKIRIAERSEVIAAQKFKPDKIAS